MMHLIQGRIDYPLSFEGKEEVYAMASMYKMGGLTFDKIYCSPLSRAIESASIFKDTFDYPSDIIVDEAFIERDFGEAEGKIISEEVYKKIVNDDYPQMEKSEAIEKRVFSETLKIGKENPGKKILVVSHSHAIKALLCTIEPERRFTDPVSNVSITTIMYNQGKLSIVGANETPNKGEKWKI